MEYLASGTPVIMSPLGCIQNDYNKHIIFFEDESVEGMSKTLSNALTIESKVLEERGEKAKSFILKEKTPLNQVSKILNMVNKQLSK